MPSVRVFLPQGERVAEVAARFSLDAMPGKQMAIDSDLRAGDIDQAEANRLRRGLERESHLFGAMDGAMKFVKGDAIASIIVILVNLIGGILVGTMKHGMTVGTAAETYALLSVGDGLVAQIPSLFVSVAAGTLVTRVSSESDLGTEVARAAVRGAACADARCSDPGRNGVRSRLPGGGLSAPRGDPGRGRVLGRPPQGGARGGTTAR